ncbi:hypothetical protein [Aeromonas salmonicida]|uniref:hypothetical protein n=1 Tax=Aeromonas salmonicida TaxID=645 RepID=UPI003CF40B39
MSELNLTLLIIGLFISFFLTGFAATKWCGPTWFQRNGLCFSVMSISVSAFASDIQPDMTIMVLKPYLENLTVGLAILGTIIAAFGEVIWRLIHRNELTVGEILKSFVNS